MTKSELRKARREAHAKGLPLTGELALPHQQPTRVLTDEGRIVRAKRLSRKERMAWREDQMVLLIDVGPQNWDDR